MPQPPAPEHEVQDAAKFHNEYVANGGKPYGSGAHNNTGGACFYIAGKMGMPDHKIQRRLRLAKARGMLLMEPGGDPEEAVPQTWAYQRLQSVEVDNGCVVAFSDCHYWPGLPVSVGHLALLGLLPVLRPVGVICNGDPMDFPKISKHSRAGWAKLPSVVDEVDEGKRRLAEVRAAAEGAWTIRTIGNHDLRFDAYMAAHADQFAGIPGTRMADHFGDWPESWSVRINDDVVVKHRHANGLHASWNNVLKSGVTIVTGHTHRLMARPYRDYRSRSHRWGIECGALSPNAQDFPEAGSGPYEYAEDGPSEHGEGFVVLTFRAGRLLEPEICRVIDGVAYFRGQPVDVVKPRYRVRAA